jgi:hypothetical protein
MAIFLKKNLKNPFDGFTSPFFFVAKLQVFAKKKTIDVDVKICVCFARSLCCPFGIVEKPLTR